jgi:hypothetical protein
MLLDRCREAAGTYVPTLERVSMQVAGNGACFSLTRRSDHVPFWDAGYPAIEFFDTYGDRNPNYHTPNDHLSTLNLIFCRGVTQVALAMAVLPGVAEAQPLPDPSLALAIYPNPAESSARLRSELVRSGPMRLSVIDASGRLCRTIASGSLPAGAHEWVWDGRDGAGRSLAAGVYWIRLDTEAGTVTRKAVRIP